MSVVKEMVKCPHCKEPIVAGATRCKHCHADLGDAFKKRSLFARFNTFRNGFLTGLLFAAILVFLVYVQFFAGE